MNILRMMAVYNEADILQQNIDWYFSRGFLTVVVDNGSTDGSYEICEQAFRDGKIVALERFNTDTYEWDLILQKLYNLAKGQCPDWFLLTAPDEFFEPTSHGQLKECLIKDIRKGYNMIKFFNMEFWMTDRDDSNESNIMNRVRYYSCFDITMFRAFPNIEGVDIVKQLSHQPSFPNGFIERPLTQGYVSRHYKLRNNDQAKNKVKRIQPTERLLNVNTHYERFVKEAKSWIVPAEKLHYYAEDHVWQYDCVFNGYRPRRGIDHLDAGYWE